MSVAHPSECTIFQSRNCKLRPPNEGDAGVVETWRKDLLQHQLLPAGADADDLFKLVRENPSALILDAANTPVGIVSAYGLNQQARWAFCMTYVVEEARSQQIGIEASFGFWDYLFQTLNLRKIYIDVLATNEGWLNSIPGLKVGLLFREEGRFRDHLLVDGQPVDVLRIALYREQFAALRRWLLLLFGADPIFSAEALNGDQRLSTPNVRRVRRRAKRRSGSSKIEIVRRYLDLWDEGEFQEMMELFSDEVLCSTPLTGELVGKFPTERVHRFRHRVLQASDGAGVVRPNGIQWNEPIEDGQVLKINGSANSGDSIELLWAFDGSGLISEVAVDGDPELITQYLLGDEPALD